MKRGVTLVFLLALASMLPASLSSQQRDVLCCRPVCEGCGRGSTLCDTKTLDDCRNLGGREVADCIDCK